MDRFLKKGARLTGADRAKLASDLKKRYDAGESIRSLATATGRSYGFIHRILTENGVSLRERGGKARGLTAKVRGIRAWGDRDSLAVSIYLDTEDHSSIQQVIRRVDDLVDFLGYRSLVNLEYERGSFIRRSKAQAKAFLSSPELADRAIKFERALELATLDIKQAEVDARAAEVAANLIDALKDIPNACIRAGSTVLIKYSAGGSPVIRSRQLSQLEIRAWEKYPEVQNDPSKFLEALALAVDSLQRPDSGLSVP